MLNFINQITEKKQMRIYVFYLCTFVGNLYGNLPERTSASDVDSYREYCLEAAKDEFLFAEFKRAPEYTQILEHLGRCTGVPYLSIIKEQTPEFLDAIETFKKNDLLGHPRTDFYDETGTISTTTIRYMKVASDLTKLFGSLDNKSIIEIGGGYGGQCLILSYLYKFKNYTIVDLPEPLALTKKYLERHNILNVIYKTFDEAITDGSFDLVISNYAYVECVPEMRKKYAQEILSHSKRGYLTGPKEEAAGYLDEFGVAYEELPEIPLTSPNNIIVVWR